MLKKWVSKEHGYKNGGIGMKNLHKVIIGVFISVLILGNCDSTAFAAAKPTAAKSLSIVEGKKAAISVKGMFIKSKVFKSDNTKVATVSKKGIVTAKKAGTCNVRITVKYRKSKRAKKIDKKVLTTKITVTIEKNKNDVNALKTIISSQKNAGANIDANLDGNRYIWDKKTHRLVSVDWSGAGLQGEISFSGLPELEELYCDDNEITNLDISKNSNLNILDCNSNPLTSLDISKNENLIGLNCSKTKLTSLDISENTKMTILYCSDIGLTTLDVSNAPYLSCLDCSKNKLLTIDLSNNTELCGLDCSDNLMANLNVSNSIYLNELYCSNNQLTSLNISQNQMLSVLDCSNNKITYLDISSNGCLNDINTDPDVEVYEDEDSYDDDYDNDYDNDYDDDYDSDYDDDYDDDYDEDYDNDYDDYYDEDYDDDYDNGYDYYDYAYGLGYGCCNRKLSL